MGRVREGVNMDTRAPRRIDARVALLIDAFVC
jgi:hypothetical protein